MDGVFAFVALYPKNRLESKLVVQMQFSDEGWVKGNIELVVLDNTDDSL